MKNSKVILVGYRATGKSVVGKLLAQKLSFDFIDMDQIIEEREGRTIKEMVASQGWKYFRSLESSLLEELTKVSDVVIATGGGAILHEKIWPKVMASGLVVWLTADRDTICQRLQTDEKTEDQRPSLTGSDTCREIKSVLKEREPLYSKSCHFSVDTGSSTAEQIVAEIERNLKRDSHTKI